MNVKGTGDFIACILSKRTKNRNKIKQDLKGLLRFLLSFLKKMKTKTPLCLS